MPYVSVGKEDSGNIELNHEDHGEGKPVVLIHGYPLSGASWEKQVPGLLAAGYRVITYDRRGFGKSSQPTTGYNYDTFAEDLHKLVSQLKLHDFTLVGFSTEGGEVARYLGKNGSKGVSKAVIISGVPPYLLKTVDNPEGVDGAVSAGIGSAVASDRYAFFTEFFKNFYNADVLLGKTRLHGLFADATRRSNFPARPGNESSPRGSRLAARPTQGDRPIPRYYGHPFVKSRILVRRGLLRKDLVEMPAWREIQ